MTLGQNISKIMRRKKMTGRELAQKLETSESYISEIKNDRQDPSLKKLREIATALEVTLEELVKTYRIDHDEKSQVAENNYDNEYNADEKELIKIYRNLPKDMKAEIKGEMKGISRMVENSTATKELLDEKAM